MKKKRKKEKFKRTVSIIILMSVKEIIEKVNKNIILADIIIISGLFLICFLLFSNLTIVRILFFVSYFSPIFFVPFLLIYTFPIIPGLISAYIVHKYFRSLKKTVIVFLAVNFLWYLSLTFYLTAYLNKNV